MAVRVDGGSSSSAAAAEAQRQRQAELERQRAEEARRRAEEARRQAEEARKAAEAAQKAAAEAAKAAERAKAAAAAKEQNGDDPRQIQAANRSADAAQTRAAAAQQKADALIEKAKTLAETAKKEMANANTVAQAQNKPAPYSNEAIQNVTRQDLFEAKPGESLTDKASKIPADVQKALGLTDEDVQAIKDEAVPHLLKAGESLKSGKAAEAIEHLKDAAKAGATELAERAIIRAAEKLPDHGAQGVAKQLLTDPEVVHELVTNPQAHEAIGDLARGDLAKGLEKLNAIPAVRDNVVGQLAENKTVQAALAKVGLTGEDLKNAGNAVGGLIDAGLKAAQGRNQEALEALATLSNDPQAIELGAKAINHLAKSLPDSGAGGLAKSLLTDKKFVETLLASPNAREAVSALAKGDTNAAIEKLAGDEALLGSAVDALGKNPEFKKGLEKLGISVDALKKGVDAAPDLIKAVQAAGRNDLQAAIGHLADAGHKAPEVVADLVTKAARSLPEGPARTLLSDKKFVQELFKDADTAKAIKSFAAGKVEEGLRALANAPKAAEAAIDALAKDPQVQKGMEKLGLTREALKGAVDALPSLVDAALAANKGQWQQAIGHLADAAQKAPELTAELVNNAARNLPAGPAKTLLSDKAFVEKLVSDPGTTQAIKDLAAGKLEEGLRGLAQNEGAAKAAVDALAKDPAVKAGMEKLGLTPEALKQGVDALPDLVGAAIALNKGDTKAAIGHLADAMTKAPEVTAELINNAARKLPEGPAKALLTDKAFVEALAKDPKTAEAIKQFASGDVPGGLRSLAQSPEVAKAAVDALYKDPGIKAAFDKLGLTPEAIKQGVDALPSLVEAGIALSKNDVKGAIGHLADAAQKAPELVAQAINGAAKNLPPGLAKDLLTDKAFVEKLVSDPNTTQAIKDFAAGDLKAGLKNLASSEEAMKAAVDVLAKDPKFKAGLDKLGISPESLKAGVDALPDLVDAGIAASEGRWADAIQSLGAAAKKAPELVTDAIVKVAGNLPDTGAGGILKSVLTNREAVAALISDSKLHGAIGKLASGDLSALRDLASSPALGKVVDALATNPKVAEGLAKAGLTVEDLKGAARALPDLIDAAKSLSEGDWQGAFTALKNAAVNAPSLAEKAIKTAASKLPDGLPAGVLKSLLTDDAFVHELVTNPDLHASFEQAMSGDLTNAVQGILGNEKFASAAATALAKNADLMKKLSHFGIENAQDLQESGAALVDLLQAGQAIADGDIGKAFSELGEGFLHLPDNVKSKLIGKLVDKLGLPQGAKDVITAVVGALGDKDVRTSLGTALQKLRDGDIGGFVSGIAEAGRKLTENNKPAAVALLNSLKKLPGSLGEFFEDPAFNQALVDSGAASEMFSAVEKMANGDIGGALNDIMQAGGKLLFQEPHFEILGQELPIGMQGLENMARLMGRFIDMLPDELKEKIMAQAGKAAGKSLIKSIPIIGNIFSGISSIGSGKDLIESIGKDPKDWVEIGLNAAQFGLDVAGTIPGLGNITSTLGNIVGVGKVIKGASDLIGDVRSFQESFVGF